MHGVYLHHEKKIKQTIYHNVMGDPGVLHFLFHNSPEQEPYVAPYFTPAKASEGWHCAVAVHRFQMV